MKKITYFAVALALTVFVACKGKSASEEGEGTTTDTLNMEVPTGASETLDNNAKVDEVLNQPSEDELFGTDVDDADVEGATKK